MSQDHNDIYSIVERLRVLEEGLDKNQRSVNQLSATFKPKTVAVLTAKTDPKNPMGGKLVGGAEENVNNKEDPLDEAVTSEDILDKVKSSFADYLKNVADEIKQDSDLKDKKKDDTDLRTKDKTDRDLVAKKDTVSEDPTEEDPVEQEATPPIQNPTYAESACVKTMAMEDGTLFEIHGDELSGFEIRRGDRSMPSRFKNLDQANMALKMFMNHRRKKDEAADYIDEA